MVIISSVFVLKVTVFSWSGLTGTGELLVVLNTLVKSNALGVSAFIEYASFNTGCPFSVTK